MRTAVGCADAMPWFTYHSGHSGQFCRHAKGDLRAVIERAIEAGFTHYGLSEHCPRYRAEDLFGDEHEFGTQALLDAFAAYTKHAFELRERVPRSDRAARRLRDRTPAARRLGRAHARGARERAVRVHGRQRARRRRRVRRLQARAHARARRATRRRRRAARALLRRGRRSGQTLQPEVVGHIDLVRKFDGPNAGFSAERAAAHRARARSRARARRRARRQLRRAPART